MHALGSEIARLRWIDEGLHLINVLVLYLEGYVGEGWIGVGVVELTLLYAVATWDFSTAMLLFGEGLNRVSV